VRAVSGGREYGGGGCDRLKGRTGRPKKQKCLGSVSALREDREGIGGWGSRGDKTKLASAGDRY